MVTVKQQGNHMIITLKNIKHSEFASQETNCFEATVYVDGKRSFIASNQGTGGCDNYRPLKDSNYGEMCKQIDEINAALKLIPLTGDYAGLTNDLDIAVGDQLTNWLRAKDIKKAMKRIVYMKPDGMYEMNLKPTDANIEKVKQAKWWRPDFKILNGLPNEELLTYFK